MKMIFNYDANKTHFHNKGFALSLVLKVRFFGTRKWPIVVLCYDSCVYEFIFESSDLLLEDETGETSYDYGNTAKHPLSESIKREGIGLTKLYFICGR